MNIPLLKIRVVDVHIMEGIETVKYLNIHISSITVEKSSNLDTSTRII